MIRPTLHPDKIYKQQDNPVPKKTGNLVFRMSNYNIKSPELDWDKYPCCGGKGKKWVLKHKNSTRGRKTLVECDECDCYLAQTASAS